MLERDTCLKQQHGRVDRKFLVPHARASDITDECMSPSVTKGPCECCIKEETILYVLLSMS